MAKVIPLHRRQGAAGPATQDAPAGGVHPASIADVEDRLVAPDIVLTIDQGEASQAMGPVEVLVADAGVGGLEIGRAHV